MSFKSNNAISNSVYRIMKESSHNFAGRPQRPSAPCPRCGSIMYMDTTPDGRMGVFQCRRCNMKQVVRLQ